MIRVVHPGSRIRMLTFYPSRIPDPGVKKAPEPGSRIRIRNTGLKSFNFCQRFESGIGMDPDSNGWVFGIRIRILAGQSCPPKKEKMKKFHVLRVLCWSRAFFWILNVLCRGLKRYTGTGYMTVLIRKRFSFLQKPWSGSGSGFINSLD
jgi:hypothetical protein